MHSKTDQYKPKIHRLKQERYDRLMSLARLAELSGISIVTIVGIESGKRRPAMSTRLAILTALKIPIEQNFDVFGPMPDFTIKPKT